MKINLKENFENINDYFSPKVLGEVNDVYVKIAKIKGDELPWHNHKNEDELFLIIEGSLLMEVEGSEAFIMNEGELFIVKKGLQHRVSSKNECKIMLIENKSTAHTGEVKSDITKDIKDQLK